MALINAYATSAGIEVTNSPSSCYSTGVTRWNSVSQGLDVMAGDSWIPLPSQSIIIGLDKRTTDLLQWVEKKIAEEKEISDLCATHPGLKDSKEKYDIMLALVKSHK